MAWSSYDTPAGTGTRVLNILFKGGNALQGVMGVQSSIDPTDEQYQAVVDALSASGLIQTVTFNESNTVSRMLTMTPPEG